MKMGLTLVLVVVGMGMVGAFGGSSANEEQPKAHSLLAQHLFKSAPKAVRSSSDEEINICQLCQLAVEKYRTLWNQEKGTLKKLAESYCHSCPYKGCKSVLDNYWTQLDNFLTSILKDPKILCEQLGACH